MLDFLKKNKKQEQEEINNKEKYIYDEKDWCEIYIRKFYKNGLIKIGYNLVVKKHNLNFLDMRTSWCFYKKRIDINKIYEIVRIVKQTFEPYKRNGLFKLDEEQIGVAAVLINYYIDKYINKIGDNEK